MVVNAAHRSISNISRLEARCCAGGRMQRMRGHRPAPPPTRSGSHAVSTLPTEAERKWSRQRQQLSLPMA